MSHIADLRDVIHRLHGATATYVESVFVRETHKGKIVWDGVVEVFDLVDHPKANRIYAWAHEIGDPAESVVDSGELHGSTGKQYVTVLHIPPIVSPQTAVQAVILQEYKQRARDKEN